MTLADLCFGPEWTPWPYNHQWRLELNEYIYELTGPNSTNTFSPFFLWRKEAIYLHLILQWQTINSTKLTRSAAFAACLKCCPTQALIKDDYNPAYFTTGFSQFWFAVDQKKLVTSYPESGTHLWNASASINLQISCTMQDWVIAAMVIKPLDDCTYCVRDSFTHLGLWRKLYDCS